MFNSTLDLFTNNENPNDRDHMIDTMGETYWNAMNNCVDNERPFDAVAIYEEWIVDGIDPQDGGLEFTFIPDCTN